MNRLTDRELLDIAKARVAIANDIDAQAAQEGYAIKTVRSFFGVVGRRPGKKRSATSGCAKTAKRDHGRLSLSIPTPTAPAVHHAPVIIGGRTAKGKPFKETIVVKGLMSKVKRGLAKREKMRAKIVAGK